MIINNILVKNFKNIKYANLKMNNFNVFVGPNNSGKSNFMQIFPFLDFIINKDINDVKNAFNKGIFPNIGIIRSLQKNIDKGQIEISLNFSDSEKKQIYSYMIAIDWLKLSDEENAYHKIIKESLSFKKSNKTGPFITLFTRNRNKTKINPKYSKPIEALVKSNSDFLSLVRVFSMIHNDLNPFSEVTESLNLIVKTNIFYFSNIELFQSEKNRREIDNMGRTISYNLENLLFDLKDTPKIKMLENVLNSILNITSIIPIRIKEEELKIKEEIKFILIHIFEEVRLLSELSDGSILLIALLTKVLTCENCVIIFEEPENSLHPKALIELIKFIRIFEEEKQFIITTHSLALINTISPQDTIVAQISNNGLSTLSRVSDSKEIIRKLKKGYLDFSDYIMFNQKSKNEFEKIS